MKNEAVRAPDGFTITDFNTIERLQIVFPKMTKMVPTIPLALLKPCHEFPHQDVESNFFLSLKSGGVGDSVVTNRIQQN